MRLFFTIFVTLTASFSAFGSDVQIGEPQPVTQQILKLNLNRKSCKQELGTLKTDSIYACRIDIPDVPQQAIYPINNTIDLPLLDTKGRITVTVTEPGKARIAVVPLNSISYSRLVEVVIEKNATWTKNQTYNDIVDRFDNNYILDVVYTGPALKVK